MDLYLYNTRGRRKEILEPIYAGEVGMYTCGPTVYNYAHIGNLRTYLFEDILKRVLTYNGLRVKHVMNITDVGHLTGDRDMGDDKMEKRAQIEGRSAWDIAAFYTTAFKEDMAHLNIIEPTIWCTATGTIPEQISLIETLEEKGYIYRTGDGIYFDTAKFENYAELSLQDRDALQEGARVEKNIDKRNPTDFALWKFSPGGVQRQMEWDSPWGIGFPGWHIECSAMSMKYLADQLDIHCGGTDHIDVHHTNEIAQSEAATGSRFFNYWMHGEFLNIKGGKKMAKSEGNFLTLKNTFIDNNIDPIVYRYATFHSHYRKPMEYSDDSIAAAGNGLRNLRGQVARLLEKAAGEKGSVDDSFRQKFLSRLNDDLNMPQAMAVVQELLKADLSDSIKLATIQEFDAAVLGLELDRKEVVEDLPQEIVELIARRNQVRADKNWAASDKIRDEIQALGYVVQDGAMGTQVVKK